MIFSILLTVVFLFMAVYSFAFIRPTWVCILLCLGYLVGIYFVWNPEITSRIAHFFGIGRGLDFFIILLLVAVINALILLARHINTQHRAVTNLARYVALQNARAGSKPLD
ncbi:DUF2304 family protein [Achromobacter spanius]|uniref:DUF2304 family protein n=1 Tax=Achromobacter spanius TaxID=217203 RepID=UPI0038158B3C